MHEFSDEQVQIIRDLAEAGGSLVVSMDVIRGPAIALWLNGIIRCEMVKLGHAAVHLTEQGQRVAQDLPAND